jgi:hypothetical protein
MKISVQFEADSIEEAQAFFSMFHVNQSEPIEAPAKSLRPIPFAEAIADVGSEKLDALVKEEAAQEEAIRAEEIIEELKVEAPVKVEPPVIKTPRGRPPKISVPKEAPKAEAPVQPPKPAEKPIRVKEPVATRQDLLDVFAQYVQRYGMNFGSLDISALLQQKFGDGVRRASDVSEADLPVAIGAIKQALSDNPFNRKVDYA